MKIKINIDENYFNSAYMNILNDNTRYLIIYGGAGSGKSYFIAQRLVYRMLSNPNRNMLIVRQTAKSNRDTTFAQIKQIIYKLNISDKFTINVSNMTITNNLHGNKLIFGGLDDVEKLKSTTFDKGILTDIWIEEASETDYNDFLQLDLRLRGEFQDGFQIVLSFNPIRKKHWIYDRFFAQTDERSKIVKTTYLDNKFIDEQTKQTIEYLKKHDPMYYQVYGLGEWGELTEGLIFKKDYYQEYDFIPDDARGVIYCDPNLSKKLQGDTTAIVRLLYSNSTNRYYIDKAICESLSDANELLTKYINMYDNKAQFFGFDGNVNQESNWTQFVDNYCSKSGKVPPIIHYKRYRVDELSKNIQIVWNEGRIFFPKGFKYTKDGEEFCSQLFAFNGKKNTKGHDDAPDALICAITFLNEIFNVNMSSVQKEIYKQLYKL